MKEIPILYSGEMVRAILDGRKTNTRRVIKPLPADNALFPGKWDGGIWGNVPLRDGTWGDIKCPYGKPGDRLWVRETWRTGTLLDKFSPKQIQTKCEEAGYQTNKTGSVCPLKYEADGKITTWGPHDHYDFGDWGRVRQSIYMMRWASRITLEITDIRVERLQDISEEDALKEGSFLQKCPCPEMQKIKLNPKNIWDVAFKQTGCHVHGQEFKHLWDSINDKKHPWKDNPWVWVVEFRRIKP